MTVYQLVGYTACIDYTDQARPIDLGLFENDEIANKAIVSYTFDYNWRMTWDRFEIVERQVLSEP